MNGARPVPIIRAAQNRVSQILMSLAGRIVVLQGALGTVCLLAFLGVGLGESMAAFLAMVTTVAPSAYYAWFQQRTFNASRLLLHGVYKVLATMLLMVMSFAVFEARPVGYFVSFGVMQLSYESESGWYPWRR